MRRLAYLQLVVAAADSASWELNESPSSALNLEVFSLIRRSRWMLSDAGSFPFAQPVLIPGPLHLVALLGAILRRNLLVAVASNLSLAYGGFLFASWYTWTSYGEVSFASLTAVHVPTSGNFYLFVVLLIASMVSFSASHLFYIRAVRKRA